MREWILIGALCLVGLELAAQQPPLDSLYAELDRKHREGINSISEEMWLNVYCAGDTSCIWQQFARIDSIVGTGEASSWLGFVSNAFVLSGQLSMARYFLEQQLIYSRDQALVYRARGQHLLGRFHQLQTQQLDSAFHYYFSALSESDDPQATPLTAVYSSLAELYGKLGQADKEREHILYAMACGRKPGVPRITYGTVLYRSLGYALNAEDGPLYQELSEEYLQYLAGKGEQSTDQFHAAGLRILLQDAASIQKLENIVETAFATDSISYDLINPVELLADAQLRQGNFRAAEKNARRAWQLNQEANLPLRQFSVYKLLLAIGQESANPALELEALRLHSALRDSVNLANYDKAVGEWEVKYDTQRKQVRLAQQELELAKTRQQRNRLLVLALIFLVLAAAISLLLRYRLKLRRLKAQEDQARTGREIEALERENQLTHLRALIEGQENERRRIAKDLHDGLGGLLTTVKAQLSRNEQAPPTDAQRASALLHRASQDVRRIAHDLMPSKLAHGKLITALEDIQASLLLRGYACELEVDDIPLAVFPLAQQEILLGVVQELSRNVDKHARARSVFIQLIQLENELLLTVEDDGIGFQADAKTAQGPGLRSVADRAAYLNGVLLIDSSPGNGTSVSLRVPLEKGNFAANKTNSQRLDAPDPL